MSGSGLGDALSYIGSAIDKPGRAVRGVLAGKPREALNVLPFSDTLGVTDPHDRVSGRNLTDAIGLTRGGDGGWGSWGLGQAAEMATDPLSWIPAGHAARALHDAGAFDRLGPAFKAFAEGESGAAKVPGGYGLVPMRKKAMQAAQAERQAFRQPMGHGIEAAADGGYRMKPGPAPKTAPLEPLPHEIPAVPEPPKYANADEMIAAYEQAQRARQQVPTPEIPTYVPEPSGGDMRFLGDFHQAARQATAMGDQRIMNAAAQSPTLGRLLQQLFGGSRG